VILEHSNAAPYSVQQTQGVAAVLLLETRKIKHIVLTLPAGLLFLGQWHNTCEVTNSTARRMHTTTVETVPRWDKRIRVLCDYVKKWHLREIIVFYIMLLQLSYTLRVWHREPHYLNSFPYFLYFVDHASWYICVIKTFQLTVCWLINRQSTDKHNMYQLLYIYSIPPDDGLQICPKHVEVDWQNKLRINSASRWLSQTSLSFLCHIYAALFNDQKLSLLVV
jgi:hypothetical protein